MLRWKIALGMWNLSCGCVVGETFVAIGTEWAGQDGERFAGGAGVARVAAEGRGKEAGGGRATTGTVTPPKNE